MKVLANRFWMALSGRKERQKDRRKSICSSFFPFFPSFPHCFRIYILNTFFPYFLTSLSVFSFSSFA
jgi:hypothetical protein